MPRRDGTGPVGAGAISGRGLGLCNLANTEVKYGLGRRMRLGLKSRCRCGFGRRFRRGTILNQNSSTKEQLLLQEKRDVLQNQLDVINKKLNCL